MHTIIPPKKIIKIRSIMQKKQVKFIMKKKGKMFITIIIVIILGLIALYNFGTSQYCIKKFILPIVAEKTNSKISAETIEISLFKSSVKINNLDFTSSKSSIRSEEIYIKTSFYDLLINHKINVRNFLLKNSDMKLDLTPPKDNVITKDKLGQNNIKKTAKKSTKNNKLYKIALNNINFENLNISVTNNNTVTKITNLNVNIPKIEPDKKSTIDLNANISMSERGKLTEGFIKSNTNITVNNNFIPSSISSNSLIKLENTEMPLTINLNRKLDETFDFELNLSDILIEPFVSAFLTGPYSNTKGKINNVKIEASGKDINDLMSGANPINSTIVISGIDVSSQNNFYINK